MPRPETVRRWTERLRRFQESDMTVTEFCRAEGVSQPSFYQWRRQLNDEPLESAAAFLPVTLPAEPNSPASPPHSKTTIELPGGIRVHIEVAVQQASSDAEGMS